jgi:hypothetical protein
LQQAGQVRDTLGHYRQSTGTRERSLALCSSGFRLCRGTHH